MKVICARCEKVLGEACFACHAPLNSVHEVHQGRIVRTMWVCLNPSCVEFLTTQDTPKARLFVFCKNCVIACSQGAEGKDKAKAKTQ